VINIDRLKFIARVYLVSVQSYRFSFRAHDGDHREDVGWLALSGDDEALAFGEAIIRDLRRGDADPYAGWIMYVTERARVVGRLSIPASLNVRPPTDIFQEVER
jgi:hypothetical protein